MSAFLDELLQQLRRPIQTPVVEYWLLSPSSSVGHQWLARLKQHDPNITLPRITTIWQMALELAKPALERLDLKLLLPVEIESLIWELCQRDKALLSATPAEVRGWQQTILELRLAGLENTDLDPTAFDSKEKAKSVQKLLAAYEAELRQHHLADPTRVMSLARDRL